MDNIKTADVSKLHARSLTIIKGWYYLQIHFWQILHDTKYSYAMSKRIIIQHRQCIMAQESNGCVWYCNAFSKMKGLLSNEQSSKYYAWVRQKTSKISMQSSTTACADLPHHYWPMELFLSYPTLFHLITKQYYWWLCILYHFNQF